MNVVRIVPQLSLSSTLNEAECKQRAKNEHKLSAGLHHVDRADEPSVVRTFAASLSDLTFSKTSRKQQAKN